MKIKNFDEFINEGKTIKEWDDMKVSDIVELFKRDHNEKVNTKTFELWAEKYAMDNNFGDVGMPYYIEDEVKYILKRVGYKNIK